MGDVSAEAVQVTAGWWLMRNGGAVEIAWATDPEVYLGDLQPWGDVANCWDHWSDNGKYKPPTEGEFDLVEKLAMDDSRVLPHSTDPNRPAMIASSAERGRSRI